MKPAPGSNEKTPGSGRQKGTPNKSTQDLFAICEKHGLNVFEGMVILAVNEQDECKKFTRLESLAKYLYPMRKAMEISSDENSGLKIIVEDYRSK